MSDFLLTAALPSLNVYFNPLGFLFTKGLSDNLVSRHIEGKEKKQTPLVEPSVWA